MEPVIGEKAGRFMKKKIKYTDEPIGPYRVVKDFLPPPDRLVLKDDSVKVTISLSSSCVAFFKAQAKKQRVAYQKMIRNLLDLYVARQKA